MEIFYRIISFFLSLVYMIPCAIPSRNSENAGKFRLTSYIVGNGLEDSSKIDPSHFYQLTDVILIGVSSFTESGEIILNPNFDRIVSNIRAAIGNSGTRLHVNLMGPGNQSNTSDWNEQMEDQSKRHNNAFRSGKLENNIKELLDRYGFDGIFFDYEYPLTKEHYAVFDDFIIRLDSVIGDRYVIGCAISSWNALQSRKALKVIDMIEVMAYDMWDEDGTHSSFEASRNCIRQMIKSGYPREKLELGIPFYARPTNHGAYWYGYSGYSEKLDEKGFCPDDATGLTFSFNTYDTVYKKVNWSVKCGLGGAMVWHYSCDLPADCTDSLFNAMYNAKTDLIIRK